MENYKRKRITVFGLARSGIAAARKLSSLGAKVKLTEIKPREVFDHAVLNQLESLGLELEFGQHTLGQPDLIVVSPGIHLDIPVLLEAKKKKIAIISEIELAYQLLNKPIIAVTGTNGKTTTTTLIAEILKAAGNKVAVAGNIGKPLVEVDDKDLDYVVAEISSYQLETIKDFKPWISLILNIQPDHLERHGTIEEYTRQKSRVFLNQTGDDYLVYNQDDHQVVKMVKKARAKKIPFSKSKSGIITLKPDEIKIPGQHNLENALAAASVAYLCGVDKEVVSSVLKTFPGVKHRLEFVARIAGVDYYNDSKATNPDSTMVAIDTFANRKLVLILGGKDKGTDLSQLVSKIKAKVNNIILIGEASKRFAQALKQAGYNSFKHAASLAQAVEFARDLSNPNDVVLLSPACASFDSYSNFEERGCDFKAAVRKINK